MQVPVYTFVERFFADLLTDGYTNRFCSPRLPAAGKYSHSKAEPEITTSQQQPAQSRLTCLVLTCGATEIGGAVSPHPLIHKLARAAHSAHVPGRECISPASSVTTWGWIAFWVVCVAWEGAGAVEEVYWVSPAVLIQIRSAGIPSRVARNPSTK